VDTRLETVEIGVGGDTVCGTLMAPTQRLPAVLFVHGWGGSQKHDLVRARKAASTGCICLTFDLRGHEADARHRAMVTRAHGLEDLLSAYDWLVSRPGVDPQMVAVVGISYGGYLAAILAELRPVRWLALRSPALYLDEGWELSKLRLHEVADLKSYRRQHLGPSENRALRACQRYRGDVLVVEAEHDEVVPHAVIENYVAALSDARSLTVRKLAGADHGLSTKPMQQAYTGVLVDWLREMIGGTREALATRRVAELEASSD